MIKMNKNIVLIFVVGLMILVNFSTVGTTNKVNKYGTKDDCGCNNSYLEDNADDSLIIIL